MRRIISVFSVCAAALMLAGCGNAKEELGLARKPPDEFAVVKRAPLAMPPDYTLRPPQPGAPRPQEADIQEEARTVVFGASEKQEKPEPTDAESFILQQTGGDQADPSVRQAVDKETAEIEPKKKPVAERLLGWTGYGDGGEADASVVDSAAEAERLRKNIEEGNPVTEGETPTKE